MPTHPQHRIINSHTHIFTGDHVPPYIARTFVPWPFYKLLSITLVVSLFRSWYRGPARWQYRPGFKRFTSFLYKIKVLLQRNIVLNILRTLIGILITLHAFFILYDWFSAISQPEEIGQLTTARKWLVDHYLLFPIRSILLQVAIIVIVLLFVTSGRNLILFVLKRIWKFLGMLPGKQTTALAKRYLNIGRFSFYREQSEIFERLRNQYPAGTGFIVLPMDMEYMGAGKVKESYRDQMTKLAAIKANPRNADIFFPFVFADPRRMADETDYFRFNFDKGTIDNCFIREYIEQRKFSGFKIYPALGYYAFDERLLPLWKYAADMQLPVLTHCIRGTIYYRGAKEKSWDTHPVFRQAMGNNEYEPLLLPEMKNQDFINNFTHPLNYLCLLEEKLLRVLVSKGSLDTKKLFGYTNPDTPLTYNLSNLKLCFGHFGGDDEWERYFELDRDNYTNQIVAREHDGIDFIYNLQGEFSWAKLEQIWKYVDWYSIITSMMLQYPNVYSDISYIVHNPAILPLLKKTLQNDELKKRVLFGTDFYVVRNHKSEKNMLADMLSTLSEEEFDYIAKENPEGFLQNKVPQ